MFAVDWTDGSVRRAIVGEDESGRIAKRAWYSLDSHRLSSTISVFLRSSFRIARLNLVKKNTRNKNPETII
jgi:hypothetical protein